MQHFDIAIIGSGPAAQRAAQQLRDARKTILVVEPFPAIDSAFRHLLATLSGIADQEKEPPAPFEHVDFRQSSCQFIDATTLKLHSETVTASKILIATGMTPVIPPFPPDMGAPLFPWDLLTLHPLPPSITVVGGGPVGTALAFYLNGQSVSVTLITKGPRLLSKAEPEISGFIVDRLKDRGVDVQLNMPLEKTTARPSTPYVLATGIKPHIEPLNCAAANVFVSSEGHIVTRDDLMTSVLHTIWAAGAVRQSRYSIDHENEEALLAANNMTEGFLNTQRTTHEALPQVIPTTPPIATVGMTEYEAHQVFHDADILVHSWTKPDHGLIKVVYRKKNARLLGAQVAGKNSAELILFFNLLMRANISISDVLDQHHYPAFSGAQPVINCLMKWTQK